MKKCSKSILKMLVVISMVMYTFGASFAEAENGNITITAANAVGATINLAWSDTSGIVSSYNVLCNGTAITTGLTEKIYSYELTAWNTVNQYSIQSVDSMGNVIETSAVKSVPVYAMGTSAYNMVYNSGSSMTGATLNIGTATYTTENTAVSGYSMKLNATAGSQFGYALVSTIRNNSAIASNGYLEFLIYANAASTADLPSLYVDTRDPSVGAGWRHFTYTISSQITTGKWNLVKLKLSALANDVNIADIRTLRFDVPSTASAGYNMYIQNLGFYEEKSINITTANFIGTTINLAWTYNDTNVSSYKVLCDGENVDSTTNTTFSHKVNELDKVHTYTVEALDSQGNILNMCKKDVVTPASGTKVDTMIYGSESAISNYTASACYMAGGTLTYAGANYDSSKTVIGGYSMRWNIPTNYAGGYLQYGLSTGLDMSDIISNGYIEFLIYTDAATADDLPNLQISTKNGDSWLNKNITINDQITLGKWSLVKVSLNDASLNGAYMNCIRNINFNFPSTISQDYQIYFQNLGFYKTLNETTFYDDNSDYNALYEKSPRATIGDQFGIIKTSIFGNASSEPYTYYAGNEDSCYVTYKMDGQITGFNIKGYFSGERNNTEYHKIYVSEDNVNYVLLNNGTEYNIKNIASVTGNACSWFTYYLPKEYVSVNGAIPQNYCYLKIVFAPSTVGYASMIGDVSIKYLKSNTPAVSIENADNIEISDSLTLTFSEAMNAGTVSMDKFALSGGIQVVDVVMSDDGMKATLILNDALSKDADYTITVEDGMKTESEYYVSPCTLSFTTIDSLNVFRDDNATFDLVFGKSPNLLKSSIFGANSSEGYTFSASASESPSYVIYKMDGFITDFDINAYFSGERTDKTEYHRIYVSEDGVEYIELTEGVQYERVKGNMVTDNATSWFTYYSPYKYQLNEGMLPPKYRYLKIELALSQVSYASMIGDVSITYSADRAYAVFNKAISDNSVQIDFGAAMDENTIVPSAFTLYNGGDVTSATLSTDKKSCIITFNKNLTPFNTYRLLIDKSVKSAAGTSVYYESRRCKISIDTNVSGSQTSVFDTVNFGAGGMVTGIVFHPAERGLVYVRTDVGGAYRFDDNLDKWVPLFDMLDDSNKNYMGIDGIAIDPQDTDVVYVAAGEYWYDAEHGSGVLKSTDRGMTWNKTGLNTYFEANNGRSRRYGECIMVDPNNSNVIYCGTRYDGLYASNDAAVTWSKITDIPVMTSSPSTTGTIYAGVRIVAIDDTSATINGRTSKVYAAVDGSGVYKSIDGGISWSLIEGSPIYQRKMVCYGGVLYIAASNGLFTYDGNILTNITPSQLNGLSIDALAVADDANGNRVIIVSDEWYLPKYYNHIYMKVGDNGWEKYCDAIDGTNTITYPYAQWRGTDGGGCLDGLAINPFPDENGAVELWVVDGCGVWKNSNMLVSDSKFYALDEGLEELCINTVVSSTNGRLYAGAFDVGGFMTEDIDSYSVTRWPLMSSALLDHGEYTGRIGSFDFCEEDPDYVAYFTDFPERGHVAVSEDGGSTFRNNGWNSLDGVPSGALAVSSQLGGNGYPVIVACPAYLSGETDVYPMWSDNWGVTWHKCEGLPVNMFKNSYNYSRQIIASDRVQGNRFYVYDYVKGNFYYSDDWGKTFTESDAHYAPSTASSATAVCTNPGKAGEVYATDYLNGLYKSTDGFKTVERLINISCVRGFSFGAKVPGTDIYSMYLLGRIDNVWGLYRSDNDGASWIKMNDDQHGISWANCISGDRNVYGRVYIGTSGRGILVADEQSVAYVLKVNDVATNVLSNGNANVTIKIHSQTDKNATMVLANYNGDNMTKISVSSPQLIRNDAEISGNIPIDNNDDCMKCYLWSDLKSINPIVGMKTYYKQIK